MIYNSFYGVVHQPIWMRLFLRSCLPTDLCGFLCRYIYADSQVCRTKINFAPIRIIILIQSRMEWKKMKRANFDQKFPIQIQLKLKFLFYECNEFSNIWWWICSWLTLDFYEHIKLYMAKYLKEKPKVFKEISRNYRSKCSHMKPRFLISNCNEKTKKRMSFF